MSRPSKSRRIKPPTAATSAAAKNPLLPFAELTDITGAELTDQQLEAMVSSPDWAFDEETLRFVRVGK